MKNSFFQTRPEVRLSTLGGCGRSHRLRNENLKHFEKRIDQKASLEADLRPSKDASSHRSRQKVSFLWQTEMWLRDTKGYKGTIKEMQRIYRGKSHGTLRHLSCESASLEGRKSASNQYFWSQYFSKCSRFSYRKRGACSQPPKVDSRTSGRVWKNEFFIYGIDR